MQEAHEQRGGGGREEVGQREHARLDLAEQRGHVVVVERQRPAAQHANKAHTALSYAQCSMNSGAAKQQLSVRERRGEKRHDADAPEERVEDDAGAPDVHLGPCVHLAADHLRRRVVRRAARRAQELAVLHHVREACTRRAEPRL